MSSDNYFVVRKHPEGGYTYVMGFESDYENLGDNIFVDINVKDTDPIYTDYEDALNAALEDMCEYGVVTHPECADEERMIRAEITE
jgi:hypothetical protein